MTDLDNGDLTQANRYWSAALTNAFYDKLEGINNRCPEPSDGGKFNRQPLHTFLDANDGRGCVLIIIDGTLNAGIPKGRAESRIYNTTSFDRDDYWAQEQYTQQNADKQIAHMKSIARDGGTGDSYYIMQWQCTPSALDVAIPPPTLQLIANQETNPALYHYGLNAISPDKFPTVILHDAVGLFHVSDLSAESYNPMMQTLAVGLNLYMVSQNCDVNGGQNPLAQHATNTRIMLSVGGDRGAGFSTFSGVIFANGTVLETPPPDFCRTCTFNDTGSIDHPPPTFNATSVKLR